MRALLIIALLAGTASAAPKGKEARKHFDRGVAAYQKGDYAGASQAFSKSNALEPDAETLFAWAQSERKLDHCDKAVDLYMQLLAMDLPPENKEAINVQVRECHDLLAAQAPSASEPAAAEDTKVEPPAKPERPSEPGGHPWWKDPVGGALVGAGALGLGLGVVFLVQGHAADQDKLHAMTYPEFQSLDDRARTRGELGVVSLVIGSALAGYGVYWYTSHRSQHETTVTGWLDGHGGGFALGGGF